MTLMPVRHMIINLQTLHVQVYRRSFFEAATLRYLSTLLNIRKMSQVVKTKYWVCLLNNLGSAALIVINFILKGNCSF